MASRRRSGDIILFILLAYGFSWAFWVPEALLAQGTKLPGWLAAVLDSALNQAAFGPTIAALVIVAFRSGIGATAAFVGSGLRRRFSPWLLVPALFFMPLVSALAVGLAGGWADVTGALPGLPGLAAMAATALLLSGPLQEEFGWRGFLLPRLQARMPGLVAALIVGVIWALWHMPLNFASGEEGPQYSAMAALLIGSVITLTAVSVMIAWLYNASNGSVLVTMLFHASMNLSAFQLFPVFSNPAALPIFTGLILAGAAAVTWLGGARALGRNTR